MNKSLDEAAEEFVQKIRDMAVLTSPTMASASVGIADTFKAGAIWAEKHSPKVLALVRALEFYAAKRIYQQRIEKPLRPGGCPFVTDDLGLDPYGDTAREALTNWRSGGGE